MQNIRNPWIDVAKGIAIILVVLGHTTIPHFVSDFIWAFHMPCFFIASGWCTDWTKYKFGEYVKRKFYSLIVPFIVYSILVLLISCYLGLITFTDWLINGWSGFALWFIPVLFFSMIIAKVVMRTSNLSLQVVYVILLAMLGGFLNKHEIQLTWNISSVPYASALIILGSIFKKYTKYIDTPKWGIGVIGVLLTIVISHYYRMDMAYNHVYPTSIKTIAALSGTAMLFTLSSYIEKYTQFLSRILQSIGKETYLILAFSQIIIVVMKHYFEWNSIIRYFLLIVVLLMLKLLKDQIVRIVSVSKL